MIGPDPGQRVGAILSANNGVVKLLGFGVYVGDEVPPNEGERSMTGMLAEEELPNPKIVLDNGDIVWGCECWWGPADEMERELASWRAKEWKIETVRISDERLPEPVGNA